ncbi:MAG: alcohol dehydrogenase class IV [Bradymonadia bacterium]|jgi:alcohol dehydrogenase class IV
MAVAQYNFPTTIRIGDGVRHELGDVLKAAGCTRPLIVTDAGVAALPWFAPLCASLGAFKLAVFSDFQGNPVESHVTAGAQAARDHQADAVVAIGGGAPLDVAKVVALMQHHPGGLFDYEDGKPDGLPVDQPMPYIVALPTTAGTGSEVGRSSVISDDATHAKKIIFSPRLLPSVVLADPELTHGLPPHLTAATGIDALTHLTEAFLAKGHHPMADGIALEGIRLVARSLQKATAGDTGARRDMLDAAMMGAIAFQKGLGVNHSCAHALSTVADLHHGLANALMLPACMAFNLEAEPERFLRLARAVDPTATDGAQFVKWVRGLTKSLGLPQTLMEVGVQPEQLDALLDVAQADPCHPSNPRPVSRAQFKDLFTQTMSEKGAR